MPPPPPPPPFPLLFEGEAPGLELEEDELRFGFTGGVASGVTVIFANVVCVVVASELAVVEGVLAEEWTDDVDVVVVVEDGDTALKLYFAYVVAAALASPP